MVGMHYLSQGSRIFLTSWKNRLLPKKYKGNAQEICEAIVQDCWNGRYFQTSTTNFKQFWTRDFGWCVQSLMELKYHNEVKQTLRYALNRFKQKNQITTTLTPDGKPFNFPTQAIDSLPWFIHAMKVSKVAYYEHRRFLNYQIKKFFEEFIDPETGLVNNTYYSSIKDLAKRQSSCYDNCMVALLAKDLKHFKLDNPFSKFDYAKIIKKNFWNGEFFYDDLSKYEYVAGDANLFPFLLGIITDQDMLIKSFRAIQENKLDSPWPLKYTNSRENIIFTWEEGLLKNYESDAIWMHMGPLYVKLLKEIQFDIAHQHKEKMREVIEKHKNFLEVFTAQGKPYSSPFYYSDSGMLWAANFLTL